MGSRKMAIFKLLIIFQIIFHTYFAEGKIFEKCEIVDRLKEANMPQESWGMWICMAEALSKLNSSKLSSTNMYLENTEEAFCKRYSLGLFQISNGWCTTDGDKEFGVCKRNGCQLDCRDLLDNDITDDVECIKRISETVGTDSWRPTAVNTCRGQSFNETLCLTPGKPLNRKLTSIPLWAALLIGGICCLVVFGFTYFYFKYRRGRVSMLSAAEIKEFRYGRISSDGRISRASKLAQDSFTDEAYDNQYEVFPSEFDIDHTQCLGSGAYGIVCKGLCKGKIVAVKTTKPHTTKEYLQSLLGEIKILSHIGRHDFIVNLVGAYTRNLQKGTVYLFMEYCGLGSLEQYLRSNRKNYVPVEDLENPNGLEKGNLDQLADSNVNCITPKHLLQYAHQIAKGMDFLASKEVIHGDLAARNVLLVDQNTAKISDFGLSRKLYGYINYIKKKEEPLPWKWMAVESLKEMNFSTSSDVWMYGVLLFEVFSLGELPWPGLGWSLEFVEKLEKGFRNLRPKYASVNVYKDVMLRCWDINPVDRPSFFELSNYFHQALHVITSMDYTEMVLGVESGEARYNNLKK